MQQPLQLRPDVQAVRHAPGSGQRKIGAPGIIGGGHRLRPVMLIIQNRGGQPARTSSTATEAPCVATAMPTMQ